MEMVFQMCFLTGLVLIVIAFFFGQLCDITGIDGLDLSFGDLPLLIPFSPLLLFLFATIFGGCGLLFLRQFGKLALWIIIVLSSLIGIVVCIMIQKFILIPLKKAQNTSAPETDELIGVLSKVTEKIPDGGYGQITYVIHGNSYCAPAKAVDKKTIAAGTSVTICWIEDNIFYVSKIDNL